MTDTRRIEGAENVPDHIVAIFEMMTSDKLRDMGINIHNLMCFNATRSKAELFALGLNGCKETMDPESFVVFKEWLGLNSENFECFDMEDFAGKLIALIMVLGNIKKALDEGGVSTLTGVSDFPEAKKGDDVVEGTGITVNVYDRMRFETDDGKKFV